MTLYPRKTNKYDKKPQVAEASAEQLSNPNAQYQNTSKQIIRIILLMKLYRKVKVELVGLMLVRK